MHSLETINRQNAIAVNEALARSIEHNQAAGLYAVATFTGLHIVKVETFPDKPSAQDAAAREPTSPDVHYRLYTPKGV